MHIFVVLGLKNFFFFCASLSIAVRDSKLRNVTKIVLSDSFQQYRNDSLFNLAVYKMYPCASAIKRDKQLTHFP